MYSSKDSSDISLMETVNAYVDKAIHNEKTLLKTEIENNIHRRCKDRLKTLDPKTPLDAGILLLSLSSLSSSLSLSLLSLSLLSLSSLSSSYI